MFFYNITFPKGVATSFSILSSMISGSSNPVPPIIPTCRTVHVSYSEVYSIASYLDGSHFVCLSSSIMEGVASGGVCRQMEGRCKFIYDAVFVRACARYSVRFTYSLDPARKGSGAETTV